MFKSFGTVESAPNTTGITVTFIFHLFSAPRKDLNIFKFIMAPCEKLVEEKL